VRRAAFDLTNPGWAIAAAIAVLTVVGLACIYVTDTHYASGNDGPFNAAKQSVRVLIGLVLAGVVLKIGYQQIGRYSYTLFLLSLVGLIPLVVAKVLHSSLGGFTTPRNGAYRWIQLPGVLLQPSEYMKIAYVLALAWYLRFRKNVGGFGGVLLPVIVSAAPIALILLEPDLGTAMLLVPVLFTMLFLAGAKKRYLAVFILMGLIAAPLAWAHIESYQRLRVTAVLLQSDELRKAVIESPEAYSALATKRQALEWAASSGYQLVHSKNAIGSGGVRGNGWGRGVYVENTLLPDRHNDFIFAIVAHQWGLIGCAAMLACFAVIAVAGVRIASVTTEPFARLLAVGLVTLIATQAIVNIGMTMGLLPVTGMTLPFVSYGGSSLLCNFVAAALLISVSQHRPFLLTSRPLEFTREQTELVQATTYADAAAASDTPAYTGPSTVVGR